MIVLASDYVGRRVVESLARRQESVRLLVLDPADRGGFNADIARAARDLPGVEVLGAEQLEQGAFLDRVQALAPRLGLLAWWPRILKGRILSMPRLGWVNFHPAYLPFNRGKHPNFWCLVEGTPCGVSLHSVDAGVDTGDIVARRELPVSWEDTGETVYLRSREAILQLFEEVLDDLLAGRLPRTKQEPAAGSAHRAREIDAASTIDLDRTYTARQLLNLIRARMFPPHPSARFQDGGRTYSVEVVIKEIVTKEPEEGG